MKRNIGLYIALFIFAIQLVMLPYAGMTWDEPASFFMGRANLNFWLTGNQRYLTDLQNRKLFADSPFYFVSGEELYPPFPFLVSSAASLVFAEHMHVMNFITAHHLGEVVLGAVGVWAMWGIAMEIGLSIPASIATTLAYALYPTVIGQMRSDAKDIPLVSMLMLAMYLFIRWVRIWGVNQKQSMWLAVAWATAFGLSEASKPSAAIIAPIIIVWFIVALMLSPQFRKKRITPPFFVMAISFGLLAIVVFVASWPWLWDDPVGKLSQVWGFFKVVGYNLPVLYFGHVYFAGLNVPKAYPFGMLAVQTPIELTALAVLGMGYGMYRVIKRKDVWVLLPLVWFWLGIGRFLMPHVIIYAKVRHFIDAMPGFFLMVGLGVESIVLLAGRISRVKAVRTMVAGVFVALIVLHQGYIIATYFPYEPSYFNFLVGGSKTVATKGLFDVEYWASGLKEAMKYIKLHENGPTNVYTCQLRHIAMYYKTPTMRILPDHPEEADYVVLPNSPSWFAWQIEYSREHHELVYTVKRGGADLYYVFKNTDHTGMQCLPETLTTYGQ